MIFGIFSLATAWAGSFASLIALRFFTGLGVGAAVPNLVPVISEYAPRRTRAMLITLTTVSWPLGAVVGGAISAKLIPAYGWQSVFYLGGIVPLLLALILIVSLPESIRFMVARKRNANEIAKLLRRITQNLEYAPGDHFILSEENTGHFSIASLFHGKRAATTALLWLTFFMNFLVLFFMFNWLPPLMEQAGFPVERAIIATVLFNLGGIIGGVALGAAMDRYGNYGVVGTAYVFGAVFVGLVGYLVFSTPLLMSVLVLGGFCSVGTQVCGNALAASLYPTAVRSTGVGWAYGIGRIGSIVGPLVGGILLAAHWQSRDLFLIAAVALACAACAVFLLGQISEKVGETQDGRKTAPA